MTWTPERIAAAKSAVDFASGCTPAYAEVRITGDDFREIVALARIGLAVVEARPETVERVEDALRSVLLSPDTPGPNIEINTREEALAVMECINAAACAVVAALAEQSK